MLTYTYLSSIARHERLGEERTTTCRHFRHRTDSQSMAYHLLRRVRRGQQNTSTRRHSTAASETELCFIELRRRAGSLTAPTLSLNIFQQQRIAEFNGQSFVGRSVCHSVSLGAYRSPVLCRSATLTPSVRRSQSVFPSWLATELMDHTGAAGRRPTDAMGELRLVAITG